MKKLLFMFTAAITMLAYSQMIHAEVTKANTDTKKETHSAIKDANQAKPADNILFLGIPVNQSKDQLTSQLAKKGFLAKKDNNGESILSGPYLGKTSKLYVDDNYINIYDVKKYNLSQGKIRFNTLVAKMKSTYGNGTFTDNSAEQKRFEIKCKDGEVVVWLYKDEANGNSGLYIINVCITANPKATSTASSQEPKEEEEDDLPQDNRLVVFVEHFFNNSKVDNITVRNLRQEIMTGMTGSRRIRVLDAFNYTDKELPSLDNKNERIQVIVSDSNVSLTNSKGKTVTYKGKHAKYYLLGTLNSIDAKEVKDKDGTITYKANVNFTLTLNNKQNVTIGANTFNETYEGDTGEEAILRAIGKAGNRMRKFVDAYFPVEGKIVDIDEKDERKEEKNLLSLVMCQ